MPVTDWQDGKGNVHFTDPGWSYIPGVSTAKKLDNIIIEKANKLVIGCDGDVFSEERPGCAALKALRDSLLNEGKNLANNAKFKYNENNVGEYFTITKADKKAPPKVKAAREELLQKFLDTLEAGGIPEGKKLHYKYVHSSIYGMMEEGYAGVIQLGKNGEVLAAGGIDAILSDSVHLNTLGSLGMGAGTKAMLLVMEYSRDTAKRKGNVTLYSSSDSVDWYTDVAGFDSKSGAADGRTLMNNTEKRLKIFGFSEKSTSGGKMKYPVVNLSRLEGESGDDYIKRVGGYSWKKDDESDEEYIERMKAQSIADNERRKNMPDLDEEFGIYGGLGGPGVEERNPGVREQIMKSNAYNVPWFKRLHPDF
jgi:hypothetical protein